jgi:outer membrane protein TolC
MKVNKGAGMLVLILAARAWGQTGSLPMAAPTPVFPIGQAADPGLQNHPAPAPAPLEALSLSDLTAAAFKNSPQLQAAQFSAESARSEAGSLGAGEFPRISLNGNYFYQTYVPEFSVGPGPKTAFGENNNWSAWADLNWNLWDFRSQHDMAESATASSRSQEQKVLAVQRQLRLAVRLAYFQVKIGLEQVRLLGDSLKVAQAQYADIGHQAHYGTASRMDLLSSHQEVLDFQRQFVQAQSALAQALRDLFSIVGEKEPADLTNPLDFHMMESGLPGGVSAPTVWLSTDSVKDSRETLEKEARTPPDDSVPQLQTYAYLADSARDAANAVHSQLLPKITLSAQAGYENPDGPILQTVQQNIVSLSASLPLFDWGAIVKDSDSKREQSRAYLADLSQAKSDLWRDWNKAGDSLRSMEYQQAINQTAVSETQELAQLTYGAYKTGTVRFLEVQTANFQALTAKIEAVSNEVQILMQLSVLSSLAGKP